MSTTTMRPVLSEAVGFESGVSLRMKQILLLVAGVLALWVSAKIQIATLPVPVTLQMLVIMVIGAAYGPWLGASTVLAYVMLGAQGVPVFAGTPEKGIGLAYIFGPTGGYILGFVLAAFVVGSLARTGWDRSPMRMALAMVAGLLAVYIPGVIWLCSGFGLIASVAGESAFMGFGWENWYTYGVRTFIWVDALKLVVAVIAFPAIWRLVGDART